MTTTTPTNPATKPAASGPAAASQQAKPSYAAPPAIPVKPKPPGMRPPIQQPAKAAVTPHAAAAVSTSSVTPPAALGQGVNTFFNSGVSTAVNPGTPAVAAGSETVNYNACQSIEDVYQYLDISAEVSFDDAIYAADAKAQLVASMNISATAVTLAIFANVVSGTQTITNPSWASGVDTSDAATFFAAYGDSFVSSITTGAQYVALYTFYTTSTSEQAQLTASIKATAPTWSALTQANLEEIVNTASCEYSFNQTILGASNLAVPTSQDQIIAFASAFPSQTFNAPQIVSYTTTGYESVPNPPWTATAPVVANRQAFQNAATQINDLAEIQNAFTALQQLYDVYGYTDPSLSAPLATLGTDVQNAQTWLQTLGDNPTPASVSPPQYQTLQNSTPLPVPTFSLQSSSLFGNESSLAEILDPFGTLSPTSVAGVTENQIAAGTAPESVTLYGAATVVGVAIPICSGVSIGYSDGSTFVAGSGTATGTLQLQPGEYVSSMSGQEGTAVNLLTVTTNNGNTVTAGPNLSATPFSWSAPAGQRFVGFTAQTLPIGSVVVLAALAAQCVAFAPAAWQPLP